MTLKNIFFIFLLTTSCLISQNDYLGAGENSGIVVSASSDGEGTNAQNTIDGSGLDAAKMEASRFLAQSTLGFDEYEVNRVLEMGMESWLDVQMSLAPSYLSPVHDDIFIRAKQRFEEVKSSEDEEYYGPWGLHFNYAWWQVNMTNEDLLRHRIALALSEILVISMNSDLIDFGPGLASYYDLFVKHAFGNYRDILTDVTLHPCMGYYLSHLSNPKSDERNNIHPDENYAREIMQLFTIGLYMLNPDGTRQLDDLGNFNSTYDNDDIKELAKIFTGLSGSAWSPEALEYFERENMNAPPVSFGEGIYTYSRTEPMRMYQSQHESGPKTILKKYTIPGGQSGMEDINDAINILFNHENVGPFIGTRLIQRLVKSNPSPDYVRRITEVFNDNGNGVRGDLGAVVRAILMDEEARSCDAQRVPANGMLREPIVRYLHFARMIETFSVSGEYWNNGFRFREQTKQHPLMSPTVFNFFQPDYQPVGEFTEKGLFGPEYQIHDTQTSIGYINEVNFWTIWQTLSWSWEIDRDDLFVVRTDLDKLVEIADDDEEIINYLDNYFTHGRLSDDTREIVRDAISAIDFPEFYPQKLGLAMYLILISPDYTVLK